MKSNTILSTCPYCMKRERLTITSWQPPPGIDPRMIKVKCRATYNRPWLVVLSEKQYESLDLIAGQAELY
jgi:hypothetical protein